MNQTNERVEVLRALMRQEGMDAYMVPTSDFHDSEYVGEYFKCRHFLTGFAGTAGTAVITEHEAGLWTDGRYFIQAEQDLEGTCIELFRMGVPGVPTIEEFLLAHLPEGGCLGFDGRVVNAEMGNALKESLSKKQISIACRKDLMDNVWENRPSLSCAPVWVLSEKYAGKSYQKKLEELREAMSSQKAEIHLMTALDEIAWLLNLRGGDIVNNPVFLANLLVEQENVTLYVQTMALTEETRAYLAQNQVLVKPYETFYGDVAALKNKSILLEPKKASFMLCESIHESCRVILTAMNPCATAKAKKNEIEIENMKKAHLKDGVAATKFMYWLKKTIGTCPLTEMAAGRKMEEFRAQQEGYLGPSFVTIAAYKENAAIGYYHPDPECSKVLAPEGLLLVDSGGHYYDGTTDITRTYALGPITEEEKEYCTMVVSSMLKAGSMKFLYGCRGINLDYTIREAFWQKGLDYTGGTGHGVGFLLHVHERPNGLRWKVVPERQDSAVIEPGMICSDEPGLYVAGKFGMRTENMILCVPDEKNQYGQFLRFEFLTWAPIDLYTIDTRFMDEQAVERLNTYHAEV